MSAGTMKIYRVKNTQSGVLLGYYFAESAEEALDRMAQDAGYADFADCCEQIGSDGGDVVAVVVGDAPLGAGKVDVLPPFTTVRRELGEALRPIREALHRNRQGPEVEIYGYTFTGSQLYRGKSSRFTWYAHYTGTRPDEYIVSGTIEDCAVQIHARLRARHNGEALSFARPAALSGVGGAP